MCRTALVTGGTRGIGAGIARTLKSVGYRVAVSYQNGVETAEKFQKATEIPVFSWDVSDYGSCEKGVEEVHTVLGGDIDILINNAGVTKDCMFHKMTAEAWHVVISTNLNSIFNMCKMVVPAMRRKKYGRIVNISSVNGLRGQVGQTNYSAAKAGILGFTKALALESASKGITVNAVAPGYISTDMTDAIPSDIRESIRAGIPSGRFGTVDEVAAAVLYLIGDGAAFLTGTVLSVNGGQYM
ncbi:MAG: beta-ketoacyl-ACP reductase [Holosporaceae bacterium]|jgi:acetoacetyl-CoA reductase|nr:beta-ketoacyl-ACP reductase [Holosporaceae bacterium]